MPNPLCSVLFNNNMRTLVLGASPNPERYAYKASVMLSQHGHEVLPVGLRDGKINQLDIMTGQPSLEAVDTVTLYVGPDNQPGWYDYIFSLNPRRVIFNPGTENPTFEKALADKGIMAQRACTLVLLATGQY